MSDDYNKPPPPLAPLPSAPTPGAPIAMPGPSAAMPPPPAMPSPAAMPAPAPAAPASVPQAPIALPGPPPAAAVPLAGALPPPPPPPAGVAPPQPPAPVGTPTVEVTPLPALDALPPPPSAAQVAATVATQAPAVVAAAPVRRPIRNMDAVCVDVVRRTPDASTLYFFVGDHGGYQAGQFVSIDPRQFPELERWCAFYHKVKGRKEGIRAYSMSSIPSEQCISITVKAEPYNPEKDDYPPLLSPFLASGALKGRQLTIKGFSGPYVLEPDHREKTDQIVHLVAGSGVVPNYALVKDELQKPENKNVKHTFIDVNKTYNDIIFREQLDALAEAYPDRFELIHLLTREEDPSIHGKNFLKGRPNTDIVKGYIRDLSTVMVYSCGPAITKWEKKKAKEGGFEPSPRFMESVEAIVHDLGIDKKRFKKEEFG